jgi:chromosome segregation ATPase
MYDNLCRNPLLTRTQYDAPGQGIPKEQFSPPPSRHNSIAGISVPVLTGPAPKTKDGRNIDQYRPNDRRVPHLTGTKNLNEKTNPLSPHSPLTLHHGEANPRSGSSTSLPTASTLSLEQFTSITNVYNAERYKSSLTQTGKLDSCASGTINSLRTIKARKLEQASAEAEKTIKVRNNIISIDKIAPVSSTHNEDQSTPGQGAAIKALQIEMKGLKNDRTKMQARIDELEKLKDVPNKEMSTLSNRIKELETMPPRIEELEKSSIDTLRSAKEILEKWKEAQPAPIPEAHVQENVQQTMQKELAIVPSKTGPSSTASYPDFVKRSMNTLEEKINRVEDEIDRVTEKTNRVAENERGTHEDAMELKVRVDEIQEDQDKIKGVFFKEFDNLRSDLATYIGSWSRGHELTLHERIMKMEGSVGQLPVFHSTLARLDNFFSAFVLETKRSIASVQREATEASNTLNNQSSKLQTALESSEKQLSEVKTRLNDTLVQINAVKPSSGQDEEHKEKVVKLEKRLNDALVQINAVRTSSSERDQDEDRKKRFSELENGLNDALAQINAVNISSSDQDKELRENIARLQYRLESSLSQIGGLEQSLNQVRTNCDTKTSELESRLENLPAATANNTSNGIPTIVANQDTTHDLQKQIDEILDDLHTVHGNIEQTDEDFKDVQQNVQTMKNKVDVIKASVPQGFSRLEQAGSDNMKEIQALKAEMSTLRQARSDTPQQVQAFQAQQTIMENTIKVLRLQVDSMSCQPGKVDILQAAIQSLEERYQNISTDIMYQQMVQWITKMYPSAPDFLNQLKSLQLTVDNFMQSIGWMAGAPAHQSLFQLVEQSNNILMLVRYATTLQELPRTFQKVDSSLKIANDAMTKAQAAVETGEAVKVKVEGHSVNIETFKNTFTGLKQDVKELDEKQKIVQQQIDSERSYREGKSEKDIEKDIENIKTDVEILFQKIDSERSERATRYHTDAKNVQALLDHLDAAMQELIQRVDVSDDYRMKLHPKLTEMLALYPQLFTALAETQAFVDDVNKNLPNGGLEHEFTAIVPPSEMAEDV